MQLTLLEQHAMLAIAALGSRLNCYGISIQGHIWQKAGYKPSVASTYAALHRLEAKGFVQSEREPPTLQRGGRGKLSFSLTAPGKKALMELLRAVSSLIRDAHWSLLGRDP